jgi:pyrroloquinoline quinone biosynthesis protein D
MIDNASVPRRSERVLSQHVGDTSVLLDPRSGEYYSLDEVGARIWDLCDGSRSAEQIALALSEEYDADLVTIQEDVVRLLSELQAAKLVDIR